MDEKKIVFSGVQPSGKLTIANYLGAIKNWIPLQEEYNSIFCIVDLHAITVPQEPQNLRKNTLDVLALYLACGLDPKKSIIFIQSHVSAHCELTWILDSISYMGQLNRMTQFKEKSQKPGADVNAALFNYPVLMAADILLYQTDLVPVGEDQKQHLELARDLAIRFNNRYSDTFKIPEVFIPKIGSRIMSLQNPEVKMSKSDKDENAYIELLDDPNSVRRKIKRAVTDSYGEVVYRDEQLGIKNLIDIYSVFSGESIKDIENRYIGKGYGRFKDDLAEAIVEVLRPIQERYEEYRKNKDFLEGIYSEGAEKAERLANRTLKKVYKKVGFIPRVNK